jgi:hypothetical protein
MVVNFRVCGISRGVRKLVRTPTLNKKKKNKKKISTGIKKPLSDLVEYIIRIKS